MPNTNASTMAQNWMARLGNHQGAELHTQPTAAAAAAAVRAWYSSCASWSTTHRPKTIAVRCKVQGSTASSLLVTPVIMFWVLGDFQQVHQNERWRRRRRLCERCLCPCLPSSSTDDSLAVSHRSGLLSVSNLLMAVGCGSCRECFCGWGALWWNLYVFFRCELLAHRRLENFSFSYQNQSKDRSNRP